MSKFKLNKMRENGGRLQQLRAACSDWDDIVANLGGNQGAPKREVELGILDLLDAGLIQIVPQPGKPTAFVLTLPEGFKHVGA